MPEAYEQIMEFIKPKSPQDLVIQRDRKQERLKKEYALQTLHSKTIL